MKGGGQTHVGFSGIIERRDHSLGEKIKDINERLKGNVIVKASCL